MEVTLSAPMPLTEHHQVITFQSGEVMLDEWLARHALKNQLTGASRTYVVTVEQRVIGYYALANGAMLAADAPGGIRRNMPDPIPVMVLGRLAVDQNWQGRGIGVSMLRDAAIRTLQAAEIAGIRAILVHALHDQAATFYRRFGFVASPSNPHTLLLSLKDAKVAFTVTKRNNSSVE